ncbi:N-acetylglucosamine-6-phosphate deacetylase [Catalinimonas alkaloidigena]|uniref:N-acetylglucosamine-6-phosphate deacetylase n=1 Tax=Catalinimonas alkaloidigena TaxID=1075417 RepID=UPI002404E0AA|nr:amidohydrolase family protein [Catalinimonas alkaloidigena]MDF9798914.1 N-acetylglucosamine-6-phosphate deacetylase [Catalinimonas alkaloidigena]
MNRTVKAYKNNKQEYAEVKIVEGVNCISGEQERLTISKGRVEKISSGESPDHDSTFFGPGLIDIQVNGIDGIDFNDITLKPEDVLKATQYLLSKGVTTYIPTLITNSDENIHQLINIIVRACRAYPLVDACVSGIHLEGPFISKAEGARGAHDLKYIKAPDWEWVKHCQEISGGKIKIVTFSPEWEGSSAFIHQCVSHAILVAIGHSNATPKEIQSAAKAGASLSTHLGNGAPLMLPRHPNLLWEQLAQDKLYASIIADGFHLPDAFLATAIRTKGEKVFLVSDATCFSGMSSGVYKSHIGEEVMLEKDGRLSMKNSPGLLAGATKCLLEDMQYLLDRKLVELAEAWKMGSVYPASFLGYPAPGIAPNQAADLVVFKINQKKKIEVIQVIKKGRIVFGG